MYGQRSLWILVSSSGGDDVDQRVVIIVPAHDEGVGIRSCLSSIEAQDFRGTMQVVVVANGCTDGTADVARCVPAGVREPRLSIDVLEIAQPGKAGALNHGDDHAGPADARVYLDADVLLSVNAISAVMRATGTGNRDRTGRPPARGRPTRLAAGAQLRPRSGVACPMCWRA